MQICCGGGNFNQLCGQGYNELLYAHLLDSDGVRLTYTHFTAKVVGYFLCVVQYKFAKSLARSQKLAPPPHCQNCPWALIGE